MTHRFTILGGDLSSVKASSALACASACDTNTHCVGWVWDAQGKTNCWLKSSVTTRTANTARVSGVKQGQVGFDRPGNDLPGMEKTKITKKDKRRRRISKRRRRRLVALLTFIIFFFLSFLPSLLPSFPLVSLFHLFIFQGTQSPCQADQRRARAQPTATETQRVSHGHSTPATLDATSRVLLASPLHLPALPLELKVIERERDRKRGGRWEGGGK